MSRPLVALCLLLAAGLGAAGLTLHRTALAPAELRFVNGTEPRTLDPGQMTGSPEGRVADALFEGLTVRDPATLRPVPGVAASWSISADGLRYVFELRADARWSDGRPVTAHDFVYAWRRLLEPAFGSEYAYLLHGLRYGEAYHAHGAAADALEGPVRAALDALRAEAADGVPAARWQRFAADQHLVERLRGFAAPWLEALLARRSGAVGAAELARAGTELAAAAAALRASAAEARARFGVDGGVFAEGDRRLVVELRSPMPYFLELTAFYPTFPVPRHVLEAGAAADWFLPAKLVANGPFALAEWRVGERIRLVRSETYWGRGAIRLASADVLPTENATTALNLYLAGAADWIPSPSYPPDLVDELRERPDFYASAANGVYYYRLNCTRPPFDDPRVREAVALAVDREALVRDVLRLGQIPAYRFVPPGLPGYSAPESALRHDPERARALLAEAGYGPGGRPFPPVGLLYNTAEIHKQVAEVLADQLRRELAIEVRAYNQEWQAYQASTLALDYDMSRAAWIGDYLDPNSFLDMWVSGGGNNQTGWGDARYDAWIRAAADVERFARAPGAALHGLREPAEMARLLAVAAAAAGGGPRREALARVRMQLFREAEALLFSEAYPVLPVYYYVVSGLVSPRVGGFHAELVDADGTRRPNLQDLHPLRGLWVRP